MCRSPHLGPPGIRCPSLSLVYLVGGLFQSLLCFCLDPIFLARAYYGGLFFNLDMCIQLRLSLTSPSIREFYGVSILEQFISVGKMSSGKPTSAFGTLFPAQTLSPFLTSPQLSFKRANNDSYSHPIHGILPASLRGKVEAT